MKRQQNNVGLFLHNSLRENACHASSQLTDRWAGQQTREYIDWLWSLSCVRSVMMVFSAQVGKGGGVCPPPFHSPSIRVTSPLSAASPAKLTREYYLYGPKSPFSLWAGLSAFCSKKKLRSISCSENDAVLVINGTGEGRDERQTNE